MKKTYNFTVKPLSFGETYLICIFLRYFIQLNVPVFCLLACYASHYYHNSLIPIEKSFYNIFL